MNIQQAKNAPMLSKRDDWHSLSLVFLLKSSSTKDLFQNLEIQLHVIHEDAEGVVSRIELRSAERKALQSADRIVGGLGEVVGHDRLIFDTFGRWLLDFR